MRRAAAALLPVLAAAGCGVGSGAGAGRGPLRECAPGDGPPGALCGRVEVFEDRATASGRRIALRVVVRPALAREPRPDPLLILAGGPGQAATRIQERLAPLVQRVQERRDVVFVDQRGTGDSGPLECEFGEQLDTAPDAVAASLETLRECLAGYHADTRLYTTPHAVDDLDQVRQALGYQRVNLWGGSYGTRVALVYLRRHPERVRSAVLDGVAPVDMRLPLFFARDGERALKLLFQACAADPGCAAAFPALEARSRALLETLQRAPRRVPVAHPRSGVAELMRVDGELVGSILRNALYSPEAASLLPLALTRAAAGDYAPLAAMASLGEGAGISAGLMLSVLCSEDVPGIDDAQARAQAQGSFLGEAPVLRLRQACGVWTRGELPAGYHEPVVSERPVLVLSGELDPVTPPSWGEAAAQHLSAARHVVVPGRGHGTSTQGCLPERIVAFLEAGSAEGLDFSCAARQRRPAFFLSPSGPLAAAVAR